MKIDFLFQCTKHSLRKEMREHHGFFLLKISIMKGTILVFINSPKTRGVAPLSSSEVRSDWRIRTGSGMLV